MMQQVYVAFDPEGKILGTQPTAEEAVDMAQYYTPRTRIAVETLYTEDQGPADALRGNPAMPMNQRPFNALRNMGIPATDESCLSMSLQEAHERLLPFFAQHQVRGADVKTYDKIVDMADAWIGENTKLSKGDVRGAADDDPRYTPAQVMGLSLVPAAQPRQAGFHKGSFESQTEKEWPGITALTARWRRELGNSKFKTWCEGSNPQCRATCLVYTGNNAADRYNTVRKVAQSLALLREPAAFMRMLVESIDKWLRSKTISVEGFEPFFRLNVLSDIPWELFAPWLFAHYEHKIGIRPSFYDYTKVPGRNVGKHAPGVHNYDLTFSYSGDNFDELLHDYAEFGRRFTVVFVGLEAKDGRWQTIGVKGDALMERFKLPGKFWGRPVIDGDVSDVRPRDDDRVCVGLRYKIPSAERAGEKVDPLSRKITFITPVYQMGREQGEYYSNKIAQHARGARAKFLEEDKARSVLIAAHTPRNEAIRHEVGQVT